MTRWKPLTFAAFAFCATLWTATAEDESGLVSVAPGRWECVFKNPDMTPIVFTAESRAENARAADYCLWLDVCYADGSGVWGTGDARADCNFGTHGWELTKGVFIPDKPVARVEFSTLFRSGAEGSAEFRNARLERRALNAEELAARIPPSDFPRTRTAGDVGRGPRTVDASAFAVWTADSMQRVTPLTYPEDDDLADPEIVLTVARNERESAQVCITCGSDCELPSVQLEMSPLKMRTGVVLKGAAKWERVGYVPRMPGYAKHRMGVDPSEKWLPDPLLPAAPFRVRAGSTQGAWLTFFADSAAKPGIYSGVVRVKAAKRTVAVPIRLRVTNKTLPNLFSTLNAFSVMDGFMRQLYPQRFKEMKRAGWDVMLDHRLSPDDISRFELPDVKDLLYARKRGMNLFNVLNVVPLPEDRSTPIVYATTTNILDSNWFYPSFKDRIAPFLKLLEKNGLGKLAYVYGFDEQERDYYPSIDRFWRKLRRDFPGLPLLTTSRAYRDMAAGGGETRSEAAMACDWLCPLTSDWNEVLTAELRSRGKRVWWYTSCEPAAPFANFASLENPVIEARILGWMTHLYRVDGRLYWAVNFWERSGGKLLDESDTYLDWDSTIDSHQHGDGVLLYPGCEHVLPSIRLANVRDGVEDGEVLKLLAEKDATAVDAACRRLVRNLCDFSRDPQVLRTERSSLLLRKVLKN